MAVIQSKTADSGSAPSQHSQPSRKGKKAWRKNVDVTEVQEGLTQLNEEIIRGGVIREKASEDLFVVDVKGESSNAKKSKHVKKGLKADEIINARSAVAAVSMRKRPSDKTTNGAIPAKRQRTGWVSHKELARLKRVADGQHDTTVEVTDASYDPWATPAEPQQEKFDNITEKKAVKAPKSSKQKSLSLLENGKHVPAVQKPSGGYSYNPMFTDYEVRLAEESEKALETERKRLESEKEEQERQEAIARSAAEAEAAEARENLSEWEEDSEWEGLQTDAEDDKPTAKRPQRKTQPQRNRIKRRKEEERLAKHKAAIKAQRRQEHRIQEIAEEIEEDDQNRQLILAAESEDDEAVAELKEYKLRRKQLGKYKLPENDLELVLPDELQESLRLLKPEGNLLKDRYRSMLMRGKVESRRHIPFRRQARTKYTEKWTYKDFTI